ncbi:hypothetical protein [Achromobacter denitrificans]|uniref:hypothetical protein n=1 Tax=Achromobacter denitrificans TaxID=32002 RepID=UPI00240D0A47|nr:hypothetical protein [Achromobacter denitrificans]
MSQVVQAPESGAELPPFRSIRGFHVGGSIVELSDAPARSLETVPGLAARASPTPTAAMRWGSCTCSISRWRARPGVIRSFSGTAGA